MPIASINRLLDMGAPGYMIAAAVHGIVAQRLLKPGVHRLRAAGGADREPARVARHLPSRTRQPERADASSAGAGCTYCNLTGFRGRVAVYEILEIDRTLADAVRRGDLEGFARAARSREGYVPLAQGAIDLALSGVTSLGEAMAVGSGLEEFVEVDENAMRREVGPRTGDGAPGDEVPPDEAPLEDASVDALLERRV